jgi:signal transduction histidine kinase/HAMP domain-containing protein
MSRGPATAPTGPLLTLHPSRRAPALPRVFSVGGKLASAIVVVMVIVTAVVYSKLSSYQREHLLQAKQMAALAVTRLFAASCAAPILFGDNVAITEALARLGRSDDIRYAAVYGSDDAGRADQRLAEFGAGDDIVVSLIPSAPEVRRELDRLVLLTPVMDTEGKPVGLAVVAFSLTSENAIIAQVQSNTLFASGAIAAGLTLVLLIIARFTIVKPLGSLVLAANALERGSVSDIGIRSNDEIGRLAVAFQSMAQAIMSREQRIVDRHRDMRLVLDNVGQGFLTLDAESRLSEERSRVVGEWFGVPEPGATFGQYLARIDRRVAERFDVGWMVLITSALPPELNLEHLPRLLRLDSRVLELTYRPISKDERLEQMVVVITDVTARVERERALVTERETMSVFKRVLLDRGGLEEFFEEASLLVAAIKASDGTERAALARDVHTLKGSAAVYGIESVAELCHVIESELEEAGSVVTDERKRQLVTAWENIAAIRSEFVVDPGITVRREDHREMVLALEARGLMDLAERLGAWQYEPASRRLELIGRQIQLLAERLGKGEVQIRVEPTELRLPARVWAPFWNVLSHIVRNTVDHGLESPKRRGELGKSEHPTVTLSLVQEDREVVWSIRDDGQGIDWEVIATRARSLGLPVDTTRDLEAALFTQGLSSKAEVTTTSGRGVGLSAVREVVAGLGGRIEVRSELGHGTTFAIHLPASMLSERQPEARDVTPTGRPGRRVLGALA